MSPHTFSLRPPAAALPPARVQVAAATLAELLRGAGYRLRQLVEALDLNRRTVARRLDYPETLTVAELMTLATLLGVPEQKLIDLVRDEVRNRPAGLSKPTKKEA